MNVNVTLKVKVSASPFHFYRIDFFPGHSFSEVYRREGEVCFKRSWQMSFHVWMIKFKQWATNIRVHTQMNRTCASISLPLSLPLQRSAFNFSCRQRCTAECWQQKLPTRTGVAWSNKYLLGSYCISDSLCWNMGPLSLTSVRLTVTVVEEE